VSVIALADVKAALRVIHTADDALLQNLLDSAEDEALRFLNRTQLPTLPLDYPEESSSEDIPSSEDPIAPSVFTAVVILVKIDYEAAPGDIETLRRAAEVKLQPYRTQMGV
jgi:hypothetical protein